MEKYLWYLQIYNPVFYALGKTKKQQRFDLSIVLERFWLKMASSDCFILEEAVSGDDLSFIITSGDQIEFVISGLPD